MKSARPYQLDAIGAIRTAFKNKFKRVIIELATGLGKTVIFVLITIMVKEKGGKVLILMNRDVLVTQAIDELRENGVFAAREQGDQRATATSDVVVGSIQSMLGDRLKKWSKNYFRMVILDEAHGSGARTFKEVLDYFGEAYHVGVTATAERHDKKSLWKGYEEIVYRMPLKTMVDKDGTKVTGGIDDGWLVDFEFIDLNCPVVLDEKLAKHATFSENEEVFDSAKYLPRLADEAIRNSVGAKALFFLPNCRVSNGFARLLKQRGASAEHVDSSYMTPRQTEETLAWFHRQSTAILCNSDLLSVGYNHPPIDCIGLFRPIASTPMFKQRLGRGTRPIASVDDYLTAELRKEAIRISGKPSCKVLNVFWENGSHDLAAPSCLITDDKEERELLNKARKPGAVIDLDCLEKTLKAKRMADQSEEERKFAEKVANSMEKKTRGAVWYEDILRTRDNGAPASPKQLGLLYYLSGKQDFRRHNLTMRQASKIIGRFKPHKAHA